MTWLPTAGIASMIMLVPLMFVFNLTICLTVIVLILKNTVNLELNFVLELLRL